MPWSALESVQGVDYIQVYIYTALALYGRNNLIIELHILETMLGTTVPRYPGTGYPVRVKCSLGVMGRQIE